MSGQAPRAAKMQKHTSKSRGVWDNWLGAWEKQTDKQTRSYLIRRTIKYDLLNYSWRLQNLQPAWVEALLPMTRQTMMPLSPPTDYMAVLHWSDPLKIKIKNKKNKIPALLRESSPIKLLASNARTTWHLKSMTSTRTLLRACKKEEEEEEENIHKIHVLLLQWKKKCVFAIEQCLRRRISATQGINKQPCDNNKSQSAHTINFTDWLKK